MKLRYQFWVVQASSSSQHKFHGWNFQHYEQWYKRKIERGDLWKVCVCVRLSACLWPVFCSGPHERAACPFDGAERLLKLVFAKEMKSCWFKNSNHRRLPRPAFLQWWHVEAEDEQVSEDGLAIEFARFCLEIEKQIYTFFHSLTFT